MRSTVIASFVVVVAGCAPDPASGRMGVGSEAFTHGGSRSVVIRTSPADGVIEGMTSNVVDVGIRVRVVDDTDPGDRDGRRVRVRVLEGGLRDVVGTIGREDLRPAPR